jgi:hypothetical protein
VSFPAGNNAIFVEGRYALGLINLNNDLEDHDTTIKSKGIQFMAGITFPLGGLITSHLKPVALRYRFFCWEEEDALANGRPQEDDVTFVMMKVT